MGYSCCLNKPQHPRFHDATNSPHTVRFTYERENMSSNVLHVAHFSQRWFGSRFVISYRTTSSFERYNDGRDFGHRSRWPAAHLRTQLWFFFIYQVSALSSNNITQLIYVVPAMNPAGL